MTLFDIAVIGGDSRLVYMADALKKIGYSVICYGTFDTGSDMASAVKAGSLAEALSCSKCVAGEFHFQEITVSVQVWNVRIWNCLYFIRMLPEWRRCLAV